MISKVTLKEVKEIGKITRTRSRLMRQCETGAGDDVIPQPAKLISDVIVMVQVTSKKISNIISR